MTAAQAQDWEVVKVSGQAWIQSEQPQKIALTKKQKLKSGDQIQTGANGRILLKRGKETIMVFPNSVMSLPKKAPEPGKTQILHQSGELLLDVEKRNVKHFEVNTPYLAAVVKGTQFIVSVDDKGANVAVVKGKVEVSNFSTGRFVLVQPGQTAMVAQDGDGQTPQLQVKGPGPKAEIQQGTPRKPLVKPIQRKVKPGSKQHKAKARLKQRMRMAQKKLSKVKQRNKVRRVKRFRIGKTIGAVKLNVAKATRGMGRAKVRRVANARGRKKQPALQETYWTNKFAYSDNNSYSKNNNKNYNAINNAMSTAFNNTGQNKNASKSALLNKTNGLAINSLALQGAIAAGNGNANGLLNASQNNNKGWLWYLQQLVKRYKEYKNNN